MTQDWSESHTPTKGLSRGYVVIWLMLDKIFYDTFGPTRRRILATKLPAKPLAVQERQNDARLHHSNAPPT